MLPVNIYELGKVDDSELTRVVCVSNYNGKWVYSKNRKRKGWEIPGGHIEQGETWLEAAKRELYEETGAIDVEITPICLYKISSYGILCYAKINKLGKLPESEIEEIGLFDNEPDNLTYKETYNLFFKTVIDRIKKSVDNQ
ncbi:MAG: NUDIX domain-containing protein [Bacilli bacterium]|nr:NUDIX domain-containing protein [Bacilli bacterium]